MLKRAVELSITLMILVTGCSQVGFRAESGGSCANTENAALNPTCKTQSQSRDYDYTVKTGEVDLLFVDDDSGSMYVEQEKMANQFPGFLDSLAAFDYQIAIITTDVDGYSPGKNGRFLEFSSGLTILKNHSRQRDAIHFENIAKFQSTIKRSETLTCPSGPQCPSGDERGIYALNQALQRSENRPFFRSGGHLAIVILSDEDTRSSGGGAPGSEINGGPINSDYLAEALDLPETFAANTKRFLPADKSVSVHSIIIRPAVGSQPADTACWSQQNNQGNGIKGFYGTQFAMLSFPSGFLKSISNLVDGTMGSICSSNYTQEMGNIANHIRSEDIRLPCTPEPTTLRVDFTPAPSQQTTFDVDSSNRINFYPPLPAGTSVRLRFSCPL